MSRGRLTTLIVTYLVLVGAMWGWILIAGLQPRLGLDLQGGLSANLLPTQVPEECLAEGEEAVDLDVLDQTVSIIRERVDALGVAEPEVARQGETIQVQLPGVVDEQQARDVIGRTAQLQFRQVVEQLPPGEVDLGGDPGADTEGAADDGATAASDTASDDPCAAAEEAEALIDPDSEVVLGLRSYGPNGEELPPEQWDRVRLGPVEVSGSDLVDARAEIDPNSIGQVWYTALEFNGEGARDFEEVTGRLACQQGVTRQLAIVLDNVVEQASPVAQDIACGSGIPGGTAVIQAVEEEDARDLALVLRAGALPIPLEFGTFQTISPSLGEDSLRAGLIAGLIGLILVALYLVALYRGIGLAAVLELVMFGITTYGLLIVLGELVGFTLTLAGIAGVIVSIGIAADSSIIYRERYRDEVRAGRTIRTAADYAFSNAFRTNLTGNTVSFLAAVVLYLLAVGPVRGFAFTLGLSTLVDTLLFATFTRGVFGLVARSPKLVDSKLMGLRAGVTSEQLALATTGGSKTKKGRGRK